MIGQGDMVCSKVGRREKLMESDHVHGLDFLEVVSEDGRRRRLLRVHFIPKTGTEGRANLEELLSTLEYAPYRIRIRGGTRVRGIRVTGVSTITASSEDPCLEVRVDRQGDHSVYTLEVEDEEMDPVHRRIDFSFMVGCDSRFDCRPRELMREVDRSSPPIDYMAKDYASFRRALLDLLQTMTPGWTDRHEAHVGTALVELFSYVGDHLSYNQDAVANEAFLETARQRVSVRRHARFLDYNMHDGASARVFVHVKLVEGAEVVLKKGTAFCPRLPGSVLGQSRSIRAVIPDVDGSVRKLARRTFFEAARDVELHASLNKMEIYTWESVGCCLPPGTTSLDLVGDLTEDLKPGSFILLEERETPYDISRELLEDCVPEEGVSFTRPDPEHRQVVRLTGVESTKDTLTGTDLTRIQWKDADALSFPLCVSTDKGRKVSIARGNIVLAVHGFTTEDKGLPGPDPCRPPRAHRVRLTEGPLSFCPGLDDPEDGLLSVRDIMNMDPRAARPQVDELTIPEEPGSEVWEPVERDLLECDRYARAFMVETDNEGRAIIRFGDDKFGLAPPAGKDIHVRYRVGGGTRGNVGAETLVHMVAPQLDGNNDSILALWNPLPAGGGCEPEPIERVKRLAPAAFHERLGRAVTEDDYARAAKMHPAIQGAVATFRFTGSWFTTFVSLDPMGRSGVTDELREEMVDWIGRFALSGCDIEICDPVYVPLHLEMHVCVSEGHFRSDVEMALLEALGTGVLDNGRKALFHYDNYSFGQPLYLSQLYAVAKSVKGVDSVLAKRFSRYFEDDPSPGHPVTRANIEAGLIPLDRLEVLRLDNDPNFPENGVLQLVMGGGK